jgi:phosphohistidine phosphatase
MRLYLVQHGEAISKDADPERSLTENGRRDVERMAAFLKRAGVSVSRVIHSGKLRAQQTAKILAEAVAEVKELDTTDMIGPNSPPGPFAQEVNELATDTMVVGHLPFMAHMVSHLAVGIAEQLVVSYRPGSVVCLERSDEGGWVVAWMVRPELLFD